MIKIRIWQETYECSEKTAWKLKKEGYEPRIGRSIMRPRFASKEKVLRYLHAKKIPKSMLKVGNRYDLGGYLYDNPDKLSYEILAEAEEIIKLAERCDEKE